MPIFIFFIWYIFTWIRVFPNVSHTIIMKLVNIREIRLRNQKGMRHSSQKKKRNATSGVVGPCIFSTSTFYVTPWLRKWDGSDGAEGFDNFFAWLLLVWDPIRVPFGPLCRYLHVWYNHLLTKKKYSHLKLYYYLTKKII